MKRVIKLVLPVKPEVFQPTVDSYTKAFNFVLKYGYENKQFNNIRLHHETYKYSKQFLPSDLCITSRTKAYGTLKAIKKLIKHNSCGCPASKRCSVQYSKNGYSIDFKKKVLSILTTEGRTKINLPFIPKYFEKYLSWRRTSAELFIKNNKVFLHINFEKQLEETQQTNEVVGLDRGINNIAVLSNNKFYSGKQVKNKTIQIRNLKSNLQSCGSKSAKRHLKNISQKENRFRRNINHCISKQIINDLQPGSILVLEDLSSINSRTKKKLGKRFNKQLGSWAYFQLEQFLKYKAEEKGIQVIKIDPSYTSQKCSKCGHTERKNRSSSNFKCLKCGYTANADLNASRNIKQNWVEGQRPKNQVALSINQSFQQDENLARNKPSDKSGRLLTYTKDDL